MAAEAKGLQKLSWPYQIAVVLLLCGAGLGAFWFYMLSPIQDEMVTKNGQLTDLQAQVAKSLKQKAVFEQFKAQTQELQQKLDGLKAILPLEKETDQILRSVQQQASNSSLRILRVGPRQTIDHEVYTEWPIDMEFVGTYHNIGAFLDRIRQLPRIVNVSNLKISSRASTGDAAFTASVGATCTATTFVYHEESPAQPGPAK